MKKNPEAVKLGRRGGRIGGIARAKILSPERRAEIARKGAAARWGYDYDLPFNYNRTTKIANDLIQFLRRAMKENVKADAPTFAVLDKLADALLDWNEFQEK